MDDILNPATRNDLEALVDEALSESRLALQRARIRERLAAPPSRVLAFPPRGAADARRPRPAMRWLAGSAAAGLLVGIMTGQFVMPHLRTIDDRLAARSGRFQPQGWTERQPGYLDKTGHAQDEVFLIEMETVINDRRVDELRALDHLTPRAAADWPY